jgi:hypothetical protein
MPGHLYLVLIQVLIYQFFLALLLEGDDDESHEDVDKEKGKDDEKGDVEKRHLHAVSRFGALVLVRRVHGVLQNTGIYTAFMKSPFS